MAMSSKRQGGCEPGVVVSLVEMSLMVQCSSRAAMPVLGPSSCWLWGAGLLQLKSHGSQSAGFQEPEGLGMAMKGSLPLPVL